MTATSIHSICDLFWLNMARGWRNLTFEDWLPQPARVLMVADQGQNRNSQFRLPNSEFRHWIVSFDPALGIPTYNFGSEEGTLGRNVQFRVGISFFSCGAFSTIAAGCRGRESYGSGLWRCPSRCDGWAGPSFGRVFSPYFTVYRLPFSCAPCAAAKRELWCAGSPVAAGQRKIPSAFAQLDDKPDTSSRAEDIPGLRCK